MTERNVCMEESIHVLFVQKPRFGYNIPGTTTHREVAVLGISTTTYFGVAQDVSADKLRGKTSFRRVSETRFLAWKHLRWFRNGHYNIAGATTQELL